MKESIIFSPEEIKELSKLISRSMNGPEQGYQTHTQWQQACLEMTQKLEAKGFHLYGYWHAMLPKK